MISDDLIDYELTSPVVKNVRGALGSLAVNFENAIILIVFVDGKRYS